MPTTVPSQEDIYFMRLALRQAAEAAAAGDVPVGAVIVRGKSVIARAHNQTELLKDPTAHAEMIAITQAAAASGDWRLTECVLYVTKEPCPMCAGAITLARIPKVFFGAYDPHPGFAKDPPLARLRKASSAAARNAGNIKAAEVLGGVLAEECQELLQNFFKTLRRLAPPSKTRRGKAHHGGAWVDNWPRVARGKKSFLSRNTRAAREGK